jgi:hypothetical protein
MKKLLLLLSLVSVSNIQAHSECSCDDSFDQSPSAEQQEAAQKVVKGIFSDQFIKGLVTFARQSQMPIKDLLRSTFAATQLNKEQLEAIKKDVQVVCEVYPKLLVLGMQCQKVKEEQKAQLIQKHFAQELEQNKCFMMYGFLSINPEGLAENEIKALEEKMQAVLVPFEDEFDKSPIALELNALEEQLNASLLKCVTLIPALRDALGQAIQANQEQLKLVGMMMLSALSKGVADTVSQAIDEEIQAIKAS